jgi:1-phosphofructokinase family hexose kinase
MIVTVTANSALDRVIFIDEFVPTSVMRAEEMVESVGGKGLDASVVLQTLGSPNIAISFIAGQTGQMLVKVLDRYQIKHDLVWVDGDTRMANVIVENSYKRHSHIMTPGYMVKEGDCERLLERIGRYATEASFFLVGGSLPFGASENLYFRIIEIGNRFGIKTLIDCSGAPALSAVPARPFIVKMNKDEFSQTFNPEQNWENQVALAIQIVRERYSIENFILTCGADGILALTDEGVYLARAPQLDVVNAAGAGDAVSASLLHQFSRGENWEQALRLAAAVSAAVVLTPGTADCREEEIQTLLPQIIVEKYS